MRTVLAILIGFFLLADLTIISVIFKRVQPRFPFNPGMVFLVLWAAACAVDWWFGVYKKGYSPIVELLIHVIIYAIPAAAAVFVIKKKGERILP